MKLLGLILFPTALMAGCASNTNNGSTAAAAASPAMNQQTQCERIGGVWHPFPGTCEQPPGGTPGAPAR